ncbi:MAG: hypothetical protein H7145_13895 [Akkermansiaceae bacterium]|nr:hypothetical protein [Armatimonadota bacterium]
MNLTMLPLLFVALLVWAGIFAFLLGTERRVARLEQHVEADEARLKGANR